MADEADMAFALEQQAREAAILDRRNARPVLVANGECHYCGEHVEGANQLFCDLDCAKDWEREQALLKLRGN